MQLNELIIRRNVYNFEHQGITPLALGGRIAFADKNKHEVTLVLTPEHIDRILAVVAESMVETTRQLANTLTASVIEHANTLPAIASEVA